MPLALFSYGHSFNFTKNMIFLNLKYLKLFVEKIVCLRIMDCNTLVFSALLFSSSNN